MCDSRRPSEGADSESVPRGNRPADPETLLRQMIRVEDAFRHTPYESLLDAALRAERLAVVEEIREKLSPFGLQVMRGILDEVGVADHD